MNDYAKHGFLYRGGEFLNSKPAMRHRPQPQFADHPFELDLIGQGSVSFSPTVFEAITVQAVDALTAHGEPSLESLDRMIVMLEECRINHPDSAPWANFPPAVAEFIAEEATNVEG